MKKIRYLSLLVLLLVSVIPVWGQDTFDPVSPSEPGTPPTKLIVTAEPSVAGRVTGGGKYTPESSVTVKAYTNTNYSFVSWTDADGKVVSTSSTYTFTKSYSTDRLTANFEFTPGSPEEPVPGELLVYYRLSVAASEGGTVSGGGKYRGGTSVSLKANCKENFDFVSWTNEDGEVVSTDASFTYTTNAYNETLTANFRFNPDSPTEPSDPILRHKLTVTATDGGTASGSSVVLSGNTATLYANCNAGYVFLGWYLNGTLYTTLQQFSYTMGDEDVAFEARFEFNPESPSEPATPEDKKYAIYLMSGVTYPGTTIDCPLYVTNLDMLQDMTFHLTFPEQVQPDWATLTVGDKAVGYTPSVAETAEAGVYMVSLIGGTLQPGTTQLLNVKVTIPETVEYNTSHQVKINQVSVTEASGATATASTRNGSVKVYKLGDTNGDGYVDVVDKMNIVTLIVDEKPEDFIPEVSDANEDGYIDISDGMTIINTIVNGDE